MILYCADQHKRRWACFRKRWGAYLISMKFDIWVLHKPEPNGKSFLLMTILSYCSSDWVKKVCADALVFSCRWTLGTVAIAEARRSDATDRPELDSQDPQWHAVWDIPTSGSWYKVERSWYQDWGCCAEQRCVTQCMKVSETLRYETPASCIDSADEIEAFVRMQRQYLNCIIIRVE